MGHQLCGQWDIHMALTPAHPELCPSHGSTGATRSLRVPSISRGVSATKCGAGSSVWLRRPQRGIGDFEKSRGTPQLYN